MNCRRVTRNGDRMPVRRVSVSSIQQIRYAWRMRRWPGPATGKPRRWLDWRTYSTCPLGGACTYVLKITRPVVRCRHRKYIWRQWRHQTYQRRLRENSIRRRNILHWCNKELRRQNVTTIKWWLDGETVRPMQTRVNNVQTQQDVGHLWTWSHLQGAYSVSLSACRRICPT